MTSVALVLGTGMPWRLRHPRTRPKGHSPAERGSPGGAGAGNLSEETAV